MITSCQGYEHLDITSGNLSPPVQFPVCFFFNMDEIKVGRLINRIEKLFKLIW